MSALRRVEFTALQPARLDKALLERLSGLAEFPGITRSHIKNWIEAGRVQVGGLEVRKAGAALKSGDRVALCVEPEGEAGLRPYALQLKILYEDPHLIVVDKPSGLSMHPGAGNRTETLANALIGHFEKSQLELMDAQRPGIVHRLDKDTTGVVVAAKTAAAHQALAEQFKRRAVERSYWALVFSTPRASRPVNLQSEGRIETQIGRHPRRRTEMAVCLEGGRRAVTRWRKIEELGYACLLELRLETGRTHQIRVHMSHIGCPVIGDPVYGNPSALPGSLADAARKFGRQALHARSLGFVHPASGERLCFASELPQDFAELMRRFRSYRGA